MTWALCIISGIKCLLFAALRADELNLYMMGTIIASHLNATDQLLEDFKSMLPADLIDKLKASQLATNEFLRGVGYKNKKAKLRSSNSTVISVTCFELTHDNYKEGLTFTYNDLKKGRLH